MAHPAFRSFGLTLLSPGLRRDGPNLRKRRAGILATLLAWQDHARERDQLRRLDQRQLRDVGLTQEDILAELAKPVWRR